MTRTSASLTSVLTWLRLAMTRAMARLAQALEMLEDILRT